jgi:hypothetical protein
MLTACLTLVRLHLHSVFSQVVEVSNIHHESLPVLVTAFHFLSQFDLSFLPRRQLSSIFCKARGIIVASFQCLLLKEWSVPVKQVILFCSFTHGESFKNYMPPLHGVIDHLTLVHFGKLPEFLQ